MRSVWFDVDPVLIKGWSFFGHLLTIEEIKFKHAGKLFGNLNEMIGCARKQPLAGPACKGIAAFTWPGVH